MPSSSNAQVCDNAPLVSSETETGSHIYKIKRYSKTKGVLGVGESFKSKVFSVGGHRWYIGYYPDGYTDDDADCICFDLFLVDPDPDVEVKAKFVLRLLNRAGKPVPEYTASFNDVYTFSSAVPSCGVERFIEREELEASPYLKGNSFRVRCDVTVFKESGAPKKH